MHSPALSLAIMGSPITKLESEMQFTLIVLNAKLVCLTYSALVTTVCNVCLRLRDDIVISL